MGLRNALLRIIKHQMIEIVPIIQDILKEFKYMATFFSEKILERIWFLGGYEAWLYLQLEVCTVGWNETREHWTVLISVL